MTELDAHTLYVLLKHGGRLKDKFGESKNAVQTATTGFEKQILKLDNELKDGRQYIVGNNLTVADILLGTCIESALNMELETPLIVPPRCSQYFLSGI